MCLICLDFQRQKLSLQEARRAYGEMVMGLGAHAQEVKAMLDEAEKKAQRPAEVATPGPAVTAAVPPPAPAVTTPAPGPAVTAPAAAVTSPAPEATVATSAPEKVSRPLYKRGWFWGVVASVAAVAGVGITLGVVLTRPHDARAPMVNSGIYDARF